MINPKLRIPGVLLGVAALGLSLIGLAVPSSFGAARTAPESVRLGTVPAGVRGGDISWPNCPKGMGVPGRRTQGLPMPTAGAEFFIIGLTNGRAFTRNPCLGSHLAAAQARGVKVAAYTMLSYPNRAERLRHGRSGPYGKTKWADRMANVGYAQANFALDTMAAAGLAAPFVWIDVEPRAERPWSRTKANNRALISGALRAASDRGIRSGIYTYAYGWKQITGGWQLPVPLWAPGHSRARTYSGRMAQTLASCSRVSFTGGPLVLTQWVWANRDHDVTCPAITTSSEPYWVDYGPGPGTPAPGTPTPSPSLTVPAPSGSPSVVAGT